MRRAFVLASWFFLVGGLIGAAAHLVLTESASDTVYLIATAQWAVALVVSAIVHKPNRAVWGFLLVISGFSVLGQLLDGRFVADSPLRAVPAAAFLAVQLALVAAMTVAVRQRAGTETREVVADGLIVGLGAWIVVWITLLRPSIEGSNEATLVTTLRGATLGASTLVLFLLATLLFSDAGRTRSVTLIGTGIAATLAGDLLYAVGLRPDVDLSSAVTNAPYIAAYFLGSAAFLHPTIRDFTHPGPTRDSPALATRLLTTTIALVVPVLALVVTDPADTTDRVVRAASMSVLASAVILRVVQSVRANAATQTALVHAARTDSLTGLPNRTQMLTLVSAALRESWQTQRRPAVMFIDVDRFKTINDSLGHMAGDQILTAVAHRLSNAVPAGASVGRMSGDEFVVLVPDITSAAGAATVAESILDAFREPLGVRQGDVFVSASIGVAVPDDPADVTADDLLRNADTAMYRAKEAGRNCIAIFDDSMLERATQRLDVETALYRALERRELRLVHQPIVDVDLGIVIGFEALMRWDREGADPVSPAEFIPIAEETGTIVPIGSWALLDALSHLRHWIDSGVCGPHATMSVNVSPRQLHDPNFVAVVNEALVRSRVAPEQLWLEVTESVMMTEPEQAISSLRRLVGLGVRIAVDDFGTGFSSLSLLQQFPIQRIKIDRAFVDDVADDASSRSLVRTIIAMAEALDLDVVAEGVENIRQLDTLSGLNCRKAQGYLISHPVAAESVPSTVATLENAAAWSRLRRGRPEP